ncbi:MAG: molybdopterin-synthase adenylyltransferase MoeB [Gammaproteobacteria bacterium]|nr:molybdopterin-synthase adenylyltransferase MoeB [Gammaproteobacteria bacterium]
MEVPVNTHVHTSEPLPELNAGELARYSRHLTLPEFGKLGQQKLKAAKVLVVGAGGLGSPLCLYLAAAGVGTLGIVDPDRVDESNLQRQVLFGVSDIGENKAARAARRLQDLNPNTRTRVYDTALTAANALEIIGDYDLVIDGTDNFPTRYLVNDACVILGKPNVYGSIFRFEGQASVFHHQGGPCYRCLFPQPPPPGSVPSCAEGGVLGVLPAIIASIQATEAVKIITGMGTSLSGRLLLYDALDMKFEELRLHRNTDCLVCGDNPSVRQLIDYQQFCGVPSQAPAAAYPEISVQVLKQRLEAGESLLIVDVRESYERDICKLPNSVHIPMQALAEHLPELPREREIIVHCKSGGRSAMVCEQLLAEGFTAPTNLKGGILAWADEIDSDMTRY